VDINKLLRESPITALPSATATPLGSEVAVPAMNAHLQIALHLAKNLGEPQIVSQIHELLAVTSSLKVDKKPTAAAAA
jgi:hypothetical protein